MARIEVPDGGRRVLLDALELYSDMCRWWQKAHNATDAERELGALRMEEIARLSKALAAWRETDRLSGLPPVLVEIDPDVDPVVDLTTSVCKACSDSSDWQSEETTVYEWQNAHRRSAGHYSFHVWRITRGDAQLVNVRV
jgi:hypothetical protein